MAPVLARVKLTRTVAGRFVFDASFGFEGSVVEESVSAFLVVFRSLNAKEV